uniref:site-specific DNA-methyltransferase (adenine-specific) n=1 Tax=viral metagenome TaxID=1070528 RepID=A0A6C0KTH1_9ZZZZ
MKPIISWGRNNAYDINMIMPFLPISYDIYIEPFAGSASMFFYLSSYLTTNRIPSLLNDINEDLMNFYQQIKDGKGAEIKTFMDTHENNKETYYHILHDYCPATPVEQASQFYYLRKTCHRSMLRFNKLGLFNVAYGNNQNIDCNTLINPEYSNALNNTTITSNDYLSVFSQYNNPENFIFIDPPDDEVFKNDAIHQFTQADHLQLFRVFSESRSKCLGILKETPFIKELYINHIIAAYPGKNKNGSHGTKLIVSNIS